MDCIHFALAYSWRSWAVLWIIWIASDDVITYPTINGSLILPSTHDPSLPLSRITRHFQLQRRLRIRLTRYPLHQVEPFLPKHTGMQALKQDPCHQKRLEGKRRYYRWYAVASLFVYYGLLTTMTPCSQQEQRRRTPKVGSTNKKTTCIRKRGSGVTSTRTTSRGTGLLP